MGTYPNRSAPVGTSNGSLVRPITRQLEQVLANLLTNAAKYTDEAGRITLAGACEGDEVVVRVRDTGIGIPAERLETVFGLFGQSDGSHDRAKGGLGIGLTLVRDLVELHGGRVVATSEGPGRGSEFTVRLPAHAGSAAPESEDDRGPEACGTSGPPGARRRRRCRQRRGALEVAEARSGMTSGWPTTVGPPSWWPAATGPRWCCWTSACPAWTATRSSRGSAPRGAVRARCIIAVSGYGQPEDLRRSREAGFDRHLVKPVDYDALMELFDR